jgi:putative inorganic carbon (hco3(-)) transporter
LNPLANNWFNRWYFLITGLFIAINSILIGLEIFYLPMLPVLVLIILSALVSLDKLVYFIVFFTPLSLTIEFSEFAALSLPSEPLLFGVLLIFSFRLAHAGGFDKEITRHPVTLLILLHLIWMGITSLTSTMPMVSLKYALARTWYVVSFYFIATQIFRKSENIRFWIWLFTVPLSIVIIYSIIQFFNYNVDKNALYWVMQPFFKDHTVYGAVIAMMLPVMVVFSFDKSYRYKYRMISGVFFAIILAGIILSYTRAAWLSILAAWGVYLVFRFQISWKILLGAFLLGLALLINFNHEIMLRISRNRQSSSKDLGEHLQSVSNIRNDASNLERINRWNSAIRMFRDKPLLGFGPGTYRFQYAPYQRSYEQTYVSTNSGKLGNAHSEYLSPLSESGFPGMILFLLIIGYTIASAARIYRMNRGNATGYLAIGILSGLMTYFFHGLLNNFLDQDKAAVPFWSMIAIIVALDVYHSQPTDQEPKHS